MDVNKVAARYIGEHAVMLSPLGGPYVDETGVQKSDLMLSPGDILMMPDHEVLGQTWLFDPRAERDPVYLGTGRKVLPEHEGKTDAELRVLGYQFHMGRPDFELAGAVTQPLKAVQVSGEGE